MFDEQDFEKTTKIFFRINDVVAKMDPAIRVPTFELLASKYIGEQPPARKSASPKDKTVVEEDNSPPDISDLGAFISSFDTKKPVDALNVLVAWLYSQQGSQAFSVKELKKLADSCGLTIPSRPDMTFKGAKSAGKSLFMQNGKNWKLTVSGELHFKNAFKVTKGSETIKE